MDQLKNFQTERDRIQRLERDRLLKAKCYRLIDAISQKAYSSKVLEAAVRSLTNLVHYKHRLPVSTKKVSKPIIKKIKQ